MHCCLSLALLSLTTILVAINTAHAFLHFTKLCDLPKVMVFFQGMHAPATQCMPNLHANENLHRMSRFVATPIHFTDDCLTLTFALPITSICCIITTATSLSWDEKWTWNRPLSISLLLDLYLHSNRILPALAYSNVYPHIRIRF